MSVMYGSSCIRDRRGGQGGESSLWGFCLCLLRFFFLFHCVSLLFVYMHVVPTETTRGSQRPWVSHPTRLLEIELRSSARKVLFLTTEPWLQTCPLSSVYLILCVFRDTIIALIICALLNVCDKKSVLCHRSILPAPACSLAGRSLRQLKGNGCKLWNLGGWNQAL